MMVHALLLGNGYAYIKRDGLMTELIPLMADRCEPMMVEGRKVFFYKPDRDERLTQEEDIRQAMERSRKSGKAEVIPLYDDEVLHIPGLGYDGVKGCSLISLAARSWNLGIGAENTERSRQKKGYAGGLMLEAPDGVMNKQKDAEEFLKWFRDNHDGEDNAGKSGLLTRGIKANVLQMSASDAQFIEQRKFQRQDSALLFMLEHILGDDSSVSYNSLEQKNLAYLQNCLAAWLKTWEEECEVKLLTEAEQQRGYYFKFNDGALLRTDKQTTATIISILRSSQVINGNEAREWLDMNPYEGGDNYDNPNTTSGKPAGAANPQDGKSSGSDVVKNRVKQLLRTEGRQAIAACSATNFVDKIEKLYTKWLKTWSADIGEYPAAEHCKTAKAELLDCADKAKTTDELTELVTKLVANWPSKAEKLTKELVALY
jgi:HK97 family phage portal protein